MNVIRAFAVGGLAVVVAVLAGCAAPSPAATTPERGSASATPSPTPTAKAAAEPTVRVPLTCDQLVPPAVVTAAFRVPVSAVPDRPVRSPGSYADQRAGGLRCSWAEGDPSQPLDQKQVYGWVTVVPGVSRQGFEGYRSGIDVGGMDRPLGTEPDTYSMCEPTFFELCGFFALTPDFGVLAGIWDYGAGTYDTQSAWVQAVSDAALPAVRALPAPAPLWQPAGPALRGADTCDDLIDQDVLGGILGSDVRVVRADDGEFALSTLGTNHLVHSYGCTWGPNDEGTSVRAAVLPGGASSAQKARPADAVDVPGIGTSAYRTGDELDVIAQGGWVQVDHSGSLSDERFLAIAKRVLADVGYTG